MEKKLVKALRQVVGFDLELEMFKNAGSFEKALDLFFKRMVASFKSINRITPYYKITADTLELRSKQDIKLQIKEYTAHVYTDTFVRLMKQYVEIYNMYHTPKSEKSHIQVNAIAEKYMSSLDKELNKINKKSQNLLKLANMYTLNELTSLKSYMVKLEFLSKITSNKFIEILKKGDLKLLE